jgi:hypothetical protein
VLCEALWAYRVSQHGAIKVTPFELVYGHEVVDERLVPDLLRGRGRSIG